MVYGFRAWSFRVGVRVLELGFKQGWVMGLGLGRLEFRYTGSLCAHVFTPLGLKSLGL